mmetsp:Transcript_31310/g.94037  ORF Transcript_31310/g.94037 Transcript_31310/m.94037 type:complete len:592 (-) Transcript_31310:224-1999(-)
MMLNSIKDELKATRGRATGSRMEQRKWSKRAQKSKGKKAAQPVEEVVEKLEITDHAADSQSKAGARQYTPIDDEEVEEEMDEDLLLRVAELRTAWVSKKVTQERNRRLRGGLGHMNKSELTQLRKKLKVTAKTKFTVASENANIDATVYAEDEATSTLQLSANAMNYTPSEEPDLTTPQRVKQQQMAREEAKRFLDEQVRYQPHGLFQHDTALAAADDNDDDTTEEPDDDWWQGEERRWKDELAARRAEGASQQEQAAYPIGIAEQEMVVEEMNVGAPPSEVPSEDISLRSQVVAKSPHDKGLGVQFYTPPAEQGVRITKIDPFGPFGRTGAFEDGDVIVEVDGTPLLYAGHAAVLSAISEAMAVHPEMVVTVCSPCELLKLEALVDVEDDGSSTGADAVEGGWRGSAKLDWKGKVANVFGSMLKNLKPQNATSNVNGTVGTIKGAPAWWKEEDRVKVKKQASTGQTATTTAKPTPEDTAPTATESRYAEPAYLIYRAEIRDLEAYRNDYMCKTTELIQKYGGRWLARGGKVEALEGGDDSQTVLQRMVLIEFPSMDAAKAFFKSAEYQEARQARLAIATAELTVLEGMKP